MLVLNREVEWPIILLRDIFFFELIIIDNNMLSNISGIVETGKVPDDARMLASATASSRASSMRGVLGGSQNLLDFSETEASEKISIQSLHSPRNPTYAATYTCLATHEYYPHGN